MKVTDDLQIIFIFSNDDDQSLEDGLDRRRKKTERPSSVNSPATIPFKCFDILHTRPIPKGGEFDQGLITWLILHQRPQYTPYMSLRKGTNLFFQVFIVHHHAQDAVKTGLHESLQPCSRAARK